MATQIILNSKLSDYYTLIHLDTSDPRELDKLGALDWQNFYLAFKHYFLLIKYILTHKPALVYIPISQTTVGYFRDAGFILMSKLLRRKVVCHLRGGHFRNWLNSASSITQFFVRKIHHLVDGQIVLGNCLKPIFSGIIQEHKMFTIPNGANYTHNTITKSDKITVLFLANFIRGKGVLDVLRAAPKVTEKYSNVKFQFIGNWREPEVKAEFGKMITHHPEISIEVLGQVTGDEKIKLLHEAAVFCFPTYYPKEGHPWVIVEALAAGLPIISTDHAAIKESVIDGCNGFLVPKQNPAAVAEKIIELLSDDKKRIAMGKASRAHYKKHFTEEKLVENFRQCFDSILGEKQRHETTASK